MNKVCPLLMIGAKREDILIHDVIASGGYQCIGDLCAAYRVQRITSIIPREDTSCEHSVSERGYCGLAGNVGHLGNINK